MQNFESASDNSNKLRKTKQKIKKELDDLIINGERHENRKKNPAKLKKSENVAAVIREFKQIIKSKKRNIILLAYQQGKVFQKFKENAKFSNGGKTWSKQINHYV